MHVATFNSRMVCPIMVCHGDYVPVYVSGTQQKAAGGMLWRSYVGIAVEVDG